MEGELEFQTLFLLTMYDIRDQLRRIADALEDTQADGQEGEEDG